MRLRSNDSREERTQDPVRAMGQGSLPALAQALPACLSLWGTDTNLHPWPWPVSIKGGMARPQQVQRYLNSGQIHGMSTCF
jgi:hypothetical protein